MRDISGDPIDANEQIMAAMVNMNLIISVDTSISCLAAALHAPVWFLLPHESDWRWYTDYHGRSPWCPTATLFWQPTQGDWDSVVERVKQHVLWNK